MSDTIIFGSHNTMSYLPPRHWWMRPFRFIARCQSLTLEEQLEAGVRYFDLRVRFLPSDGTPYFCHGYMPFSRFSDRPDDLLLAARTIAARAEELHRKHYIRIILEDMGQSDFQFHSMFRECELLCQEIASSCKYVQFLSVFRRSDERLIYSFCVSSPVYTRFHLRNYYSSSTATGPFPWYKRVLYRLYPKSFATFIRSHFHSSRLGCSLFETVHVFDFVDSELTRQ